MKTSKHIFIHSTTREYEQCETPKKIANSFKSTLTPTITPGVRLSLFPTLQSLTRL